MPKSPKPKYICNTKTGKCRLISPGKTKSPNKKLLKTTTTTTSKPTFLFVNADLKHTVLYKPKQLVNKIISPFLLLNFQPHTSSNELMKKLTALKMGGTFVFLSANRTHVIVTGIADANEFVEKLSGYKKLVSIRTHTNKVLYSGKDEDDD
jgi:hypothetical protein